MMNKIILYLDNNHNKHKKNHIDMELNITYLDKIKEKWRGRWFCSNRM